MKTGRAVNEISSFILVSYAVWMAVSLRWILEFIEQGHPFLWLLSAILAVYGLLMGFGPAVARRTAWAGHLYLGLQAALVIGAMLLYFELDFFALLFLPLAGQAMQFFRRPAALTWVLIFGLAITFGQVVQFGWPEAASFTFLYLAGLVFVASFSTVTMRANEARRESERLLVELQKAHRQLQDLAGQAEDLAIANERNRLARELHDSVAQTLYGLTLQAEAAARKVRAGRPQDAVSALNEMRDSAQQSLQDTRLLIFELRPPILEREGLAAALRARLEAVESRSGLEIQYDLDHGTALPVPVEAALFGISKEALNNVLKHAQATRVQVSLEKLDPGARLTIRDDGTGFDPDTAHALGGLGLRGLEERADQIGGKLEIVTSPGKGTLIRVEV